MAGEKQLTVAELVDGVMPCIKAKQYSESYISGFQQIFNRMLSYCDEHDVQYFSTELAQQFLQDCYDVQPGTVERRCSRAHRAMDLLSDYQHFGTVMIRRRLDRTFPAALEAASEGYLKQMELRGRRKNTVLSHRKFLFRFTDFEEMLAAFRQAILEKPAHHAALSAQLRSEAGRNMNQIGG